MRRTDYRYAGSLLESGPQIQEQARTTTPDIFAPPQDSSDETSIAAEDDGSSGDVDCVGVAHRRKSTSPRKSTSGKNNGLLPGNRRRQSGMEPSNIHATRFGSSKEEKGLSSSQDSQKKGRDKVDEDEEDMSGMWSQSKRPKTGYGGSSQRSTQDNIHHSSKSSQHKKPPKQTIAPDDGEGKPALRLLKDTDKAIARGARNLSY